MTRLQKTITVNAPVHAVFEFIRNPANLAPLVPELLVIDDIQRSADGGCSYRWEFKLLNVRFIGTGKVTDCLAHEHHVSVIEGGITGSVSWAVQPELDMTHITLAVEYMLPPHFLQKHGARAVAVEVEKTLVAMLHSLQTTLEKAAGHTPALDKAGAP